MPGAASLGMRAARTGALFALFIGILIAPAKAADDHHAIWHRLLQAHVKPVSDGNSTAVDYAGMRASRDQLDRYLSALAQVSKADFERWSEPAQLAFLINAYNAHTVALILTAYPDLDSIRELGGWFSSPWEQAIAPLLGKTRTLDDIEHEMIREHYHEPRIHFAVNCASIGCPALRREAYTGDALEQQLSDQTRQFLRDRSRNRIEGNTLRVSKIFNWYGDDFTTGWRGIDSLSAFLARYRDALGLTDAQTQALRSGELDIGFLPYDWALNDTR
ncbi:DUF547 domain-containing protein [Alteromonas halophila]|uniref:DUF547 domain-containing protein n=1 Tax=Alteromonas halophila TaxID=516698 RepID=A0A918MVW8_9ALTE|nr:DUF547 domain-containing protein [Alteromonas halophila]GGW77833.1 DUF547 domain-containing protein [Alteromonas halophila]